MFDLLIRGGQVLDGTGAPARHADVGVVAGKITAIEALAQASARQVIDATGKVVAPGFIDMHSHSDVNLIASPRGESKIRQGVTTEVVGNCAFSPFPAGRLQPEQLHASLAPVFYPSVRWDWTSLKEYAARVHAAGTALNVAPQLGHVALRLAVMSEENRPPTAEEMMAMRRLAAQAMEQGAFAFTTGLTYAPGSFASTDELVEIAKVVGQYGGFYATHMRVWAGYHFKAVEEAIEIGRRAGLPVQVSHAAIIDSRYWGQADVFVRLMEQARDAGVDVTYDVYPYVASSSILSQHGPEWMRAGGVDVMVERLKNPEVRRRIKQDMACGWFKGIPWEWDKILVGTAFTEANQSVIGKSLAEIAQLCQADPMDVFLDLIQEERDQVWGIFFNRTEDDVRYFLAHPLGMVGSDGLAVAPYDATGVGKPHPRYYGTYPRVLGKYVRQEQVLSLEAAVYKMTGFCAQRLGLKDRGVIAKGKAADLVVFDPATVIDRATFENPHQYPEGIEYVLVNGQVVIDRGEHTGALPGKVLRRGTS